MYFWNFFLGFGEVMGFRPADRAEMSNNGRGSANVFHRLYRCRNSFFALTLSRFEIPGWVKM